LPEADGLPGSDWLPGVSVAGLVGNGVVLQRGAWIAACAADGAELG